MVRGRGYVEIARTFPQPGGSSRIRDGDLGERRGGGRRGARRRRASARASSTAIGITNQRETTIVWERATGRPLANAIVWQDRRTAERCRELPAELIRERTGLVPDPYFSATKLEWLLARVDAAARRARVRHGRRWLVWNLTRRPASTQPTGRTRRGRCSSTSARLAWDDELLALFGVDRALLPDVVESSGVVGEAELFGATVPIAGLVGDQQAALFGQGCFAPREAKATYGTGASCS